MIEINRLTNRENWFYIETANMVADLGTRNGAKIEDVSEDSKWLNGQNWCKNIKEIFPIKSVNKINLSNDDVKLYKEENLVLKQLLVDYSKSCPVWNNGVLNPFMPEEFSRMK